MKKLIMIIFFLQITLFAVGQSNEKIVNVSEYIELGGISQWIITRGTDSSNPILLFLHGGPGFPESPFAHYDSKEIEKHFIVVNWDQRGCGKSACPELPLESINMDQILIDAKELIEYLKVRFGQQKIYLLGHSWGSILGINLIQKYPEDFYAYIGMGQVISMAEGEVASYNYALNRAIDSNDTTSVEKLKSLGPPPYNNYDQIKTQRAILSKFGGAFKSITYGDIIKIMMASPDYSSEDKRSFMESFTKIQNILWPDLMKIDFVNTFQKYQIPIYFFLGKYDHGCPFELVEEYFARIDAPYKEIIWFDNSGHWPNIEEPEKYQRELVKILSLNK